MNTRINKNNNNKKSKKPGEGGKGQRKKNFEEKKNFIPYFIFILCVEWPNYQKIKIK